MKESNNDFVGMAVEFAGRLGLDPVETQDMVARQISQAGDIGLSKSTFTIGINTPPLGDYGRVVEGLNKLLPKDLLQAIVPSAVIERLGGWTRRLPEVDGGKPGIAQDPVVILAIGAMRGQNQTHKQQRKDLLDFAKQQSSERHATVGMDPLTWL